MALVRIVIPSNSNARLRFRSVARFTEQVAVLDALDNPFEEEAAVDLCAFGPTGRGTIDLIDGPVASISAALEDVDDAD